MSYNILAPSLVKKVDYGNVPQEYLEWGNRLRMIQREILWAAPHILCLQETEKDCELFAFLQAHGFEGASCVKPDPERNDGPAIYFDKARFELVTRMVLPFNYKLPPGPGKVETASQRLYEKGNCGLIVALKLKGESSDNRIFLVGNTHLNFNSNRGDIKLAEIKMLTDALATLKRHYLKEKLRVAVIVCGDFNATPRGGVYEFMRTGSFDCLKLDRYTISGQHFA